MQIRIKTEIPSSLNMRRYLDRCPHQNERLTIRGRCFRNNDLEEVHDIQGRAMWASDMDDFYADVEDRPPMVALFGKLQFTSSMQI